MTDVVIPHLTVCKAAELLHTTMPEVDAMVADRTLDAFEIDGTLRVSQLSVIEAGVRQFWSVLESEGLR